MKESAESYNRTEVMTARQSKLIIMMYDGAIRFAGEGLRRIREHDIEGRGIYLGKAQDIVQELLNTLDRDKGGEVAKNLSRLYQYVNRNLIMANVQGKEKFVVDSIHVLSELREGWKEIAAPAVPETGKPSCVKTQAIAPMVGTGIAIQA